MEQFAKIRQQANSKLDNQKQIFKTLVAVEDILREQNASLNPTAYFAALMSTISTVPVPSQDIQSSILYLLAIVLPLIPHPILRSKYLEIRAVLVTPLSTLPETPGSALALRSTIACLETLLMAQDAATWSQPVTQKFFQTVVSLTVDPRPKVRKRAQDCVRAVLGVTLPPLARHPGGSTMAEFAIRILKQGGKMDLQQALHLLVLVRSVLPSWPKERLLPLTEHLLAIPKMNKAFLTVSAFEIFEALFDEGTDFEWENVEVVLEAVVELQPSANDEQVMPVWCEVIGRGFPVFAKTNPQKAAAYVPPLFVTLFPLLQSSPPRINVAITSMLARLARNCISDDMIQLTLGNAKKKPGLKDIIATVELGLGIRYQSAWAEVLEVVRALFERLHRKSAPLLDSMVDLLGNLRLDPESTYKDALDSTLGAAIANMGPENFLRVLPLNLENPGANKSIGRAFLLPLLKDYTTNTELGFFVREFLPLVKRLKSKAQEFEEAGSAISAKVYETLAQQIYALIPGFCDLPLDLVSSFTIPVAEEFSNILYTEPDLRAVVCQGLQLLVEKNIALSKSAVEVNRLGVTREQAWQNVAYLGSLATNFLAVFFNVFSQTVPMYRGYILDVIRAYLSIAPPAEVNATFEKVLGLLSQASQSQVPTPAASDPMIPPPMSYTMMDLATSMVPFLDAQSSEKLYELVTTMFAREEDASLQKKAYKAVNRMSESEIGRRVLLTRIEDFQQKLLNATVATSPGAKKERLQTLVLTVGLLPSNDLHLIPSVLSEAVVSTKEVNEKARNVAYELLVAMGKKMRDGGTVVSSRIEGMDQSMPDATATVDEYFLMVTAGLAGQTPHMISASISSLSRLLFEFKDSLSSTMLSDLLQTLHLFIGSANREVAKSALGFIKVATVSLEPALLTPHLQGIVEGILTWSRVHKSHFKVKVRHIFERLLRKFSYEDIIVFVPEADKKLLVNIKKRKERAKRRKNAAVEDAGSDDEDEVEDATRADRKEKQVFASAYEDALYGSESDLDVSDEEGGHGMDVDAPRAAAGKKSKKKLAAETWIKEDQEGPLDFLDRNVVSRVTSSNPINLLRRSKAHQQSLAATNAFPIDVNGRLMINDSDSDADQPTTGNPASEDNREGENHYLEAQTSNDGFTRGQGNRIKFNKRGRGDDDTDMMDVDDVGGTKKVAEKKRRGNAGQIVPLGKEYKARKAGGDVKRKGKPDPYAYIPLSKMVVKKKGKVGPKVTITGKVRRK